MAKQITIKDIALMAGVSTGTVDRLLHNRGKVSDKSREKVEQVLREVDYKMNIHASAISFRKQFTLVVVIPTFSPGEYWGTVRNGIESALQEYADIGIECVWFPYSQYDVYSCRSTFESVLGMSPDAVIIGPTFESETLSFCKQLDDKKTPYVFVDSAIDGTSPWATFSVDQFACGRLMAHLLEAALPEGAEMAILGARRVGGERAHNSQERENGFRSFFEEAGKGERIHKFFYMPLSPEESSEQIVAFLKANPNVRGVAVMNSRGYILADILQGQGINHVKLACFDITTGNLRHLQEGRISFLLCQNPEKQGFEAVKSLINCLLYRQPEKNPRHLMSIDILLKENLPYYQQ